MVPFDTATYHGAPRRSTLDRFVAGPVYRKTRGSIILSLAGRPLMTKPKGGAADRSRRAMLKHTAMMGGLAAAASFFPATTQAQAGRGARGAQAQQTTGSTLVLLGTQGGPNINLTRSETASALLVDGQPYLIDCGYGTLRALVQAGIRLVDVGSVFVTHLHDDHTADIAAFLTHKWTNGSNN